MEGNQDIFKQHLNDTLRVLDRFPTIAANHARNFFDKSWTLKAFRNGGLEMWKPVRGKDGTSKERPLVASGRLRRSLRTDPGVVYTDVEYAAIHNNGGTIDATQDVKAHTRKGGNVKAHKRIVRFTMPKRQFMGPSVVLDQELEDLAVDLITNSLSKR